MDSPDASPPRRKRTDSPDASPPRRKRTSSPDASPPRRKRTHSPDASPPRKKPQPEPPAPKEPPKPTGLVRADELRKELERVKAKKKAQETNAEAMGRGAETVRRDRRGRRLEMLEQMDKQEAGVVDEDARNRTWGRGDQQKDEAAERAKRIEEEKYTTFARRADDVDMNSWMQEKDRWGDPMAGLIKVKGVKKKEYVGWCPPNRFNIRPDYKWDGVDRSSGFEAEFFRNMGNQALKEKQAYKWSTEDM